MSDTTKDDINAVFALLGLETEESRARFNVAETTELPTLSYRLVISGSSDPFSKSVR